MNLSEQQLKAVRAPLNRPVVVLAGPGSGKTTVLTHRLAWMTKTKDISPSRILAVTFGVKMAEEMSHRASLMGAGIPSENISTIHAFCFRTLRAWGDRRQRAKNWTIRAAIQDQMEFDGWLAPIKSVDWWIDRSKQDGAPQTNFGLSEYFKSMASRADFNTRSITNLTRCALAVRDRLQRDGTLTYADMVNDVWQTLSTDLNKLSLLRDRYRYVLVDEGQDTFPLAVKILRLVAPEHFFIVGDSDQLLFRYTGASPEKNLYDIAKDALTLKLSENRRSVPAIVEASDRLIRNNYTPETNKFRKKLTATRPPSKIDEPVIVVHQAFDQADEARWIAQTILDEELPIEQVFVSARTNAQIGVIERAMMLQEIPYIVTGNAGFFQRRHIQEALAYLRLALNESDDESFEKIYNISTKDFRSGNGRHIGHRFLGARFLSEVSRPGGRVLAIRKGLYSDRFRRGVLDLLSFLDRLHAMIYDSSQAATSHQLMQVIVADCYLPHYQEENGIESLDASAADDVYDDLVALLEMSNDYPAPADFVGFVDKMIDYESDASNARRVVELTTVHGVKGRERDYMFTAGWSEGLLPHARVLGTYQAPKFGGDNRETLEMLNDSTVSDERCIAYVAVTRARERVFISTVSELNGKPMEPSRFLSELLPVEEVKK